MYVRTYVCMYIFVHVHAHVRMYVYIYTHKYSASVFRIVGSYNRDRRATLHNKHVVAPVRLPQDLSPLGL